MTQTKTHCLSARPLIKSNTLYHLLITSTRRPESWTGRRRLNVRRGKQSSRQTGSGGKHPVYRSWTERCPMANSGNHIFLPHPTNTQRVVGWWGLRVGGAQSISLTINPSGELVCWTLAAAHTHTLVVCLCR